MVFPIFITHSIYRAKCALFLCHVRAIFAKRASLETETFTTVLFARFIQDGANI